MEAPVAAPSTAVPTPEDFATADADDAPPPASAAVDVPTPALLPQIPADYVRR